MAYRIRTAGGDATLSRRASSWESRADQPVRLSKASGTPGFHSPQLGFRALLRTGGSRVQRCQPRRREWVSFTIDAVRHRLVRSLVDGYLRLRFQRGHIEYRPCIDNRLAEDGARVVRQVN